MLHFLPYPLHFFLPFHLLLTQHPKLNPTLHFTFPTPLPQVAADIDPDKRLTTVRYFYCELTYCHVWVIEAMT